MHTTTASTCEKPQRRKTTLRPGKSLRVISTTSGESASALPKSARPMQPRSVASGSFGAACIAQRGVGPAPAIRPSTGEEAFA
jgi:hypothetical protein